MGARLPWQPQCYVNTSFVLCPIEVLFGNTLCNRPSGINLIRGQIQSWSGGKERTRGDQNLLGELCFLGILKFLPLPQKELCGATKNNTGEHSKIRGDWEKFKYEGACKISWEFEKIEGARLSGGLLQRGVWYEAFFR